MRFPLYFFLSVFTALAYPLTSTVSKTNSYIVVFQDSSSVPSEFVSSLEKQIEKLGAKITYQYTSIIKGFAITIDSSKLDKLRSLNDKSYPFIIEEDKKVDAFL